MNVKEAVKVALEYVSDVFRAESVTNVGLEEVVFDDTRKMWRVTVGFSRPWDYPSQPAVLRTLGEPRATPVRQYKVVLVNAETKEVVGLEIRGEK